MNLIQEIQRDLMEESAQLAPILLKVRFLAARLGSGLLAEWVKFESEGYPEEAELPDYRKLSVSYVGEFSGPFGSGIRNAPLPRALIEKFAGVRWTNYELRQSISGIDVLAGSSDDGVLQIDASNLPLLIQGKIYPDYVCNGVRGLISRASLVEIQHAVRSRILELTLEIERSVPAASDISMATVSSAAPAGAGSAVTNIAQQVIHGPYTAISNAGAHAAITVNVATGNGEDVKRALISAGIPEGDAADFSSILASEQPDQPSAPFGPNARTWLQQAVSKSLSGIWNVGIATVSGVLTEAAKRYYGLA